MKKFFLLFVGVFLTICVFGQSPGTGAVWLSEYAKSNKTIIAQNNNENNHFTLLCVAENSKKVKNKKK